MSDVHCITRACKKCGVIKPLTDFPKHPTCKDGRMWTCGECHRDLKENPVFKNDNGRIGWEQEKAVYDILRSIGVYAQPGINTLWGRVDVVAWGCVRIEVKATRVKNERYSFNFSNQLRKGKIAADLVVLCAVGLEQTSYHVFRADEPYFYQADGTIKSAVCYVPDRKVKLRRDWHFPLTFEIMQDARDAWYLVEECRQLISLSLSSGRYVEPIEEQNHSRRANASNRMPSRYRGEI